MKLARNRGHVNRDEEEKDRDCEEKPAEKEQPSSNSEETSGETDPEFVPDAGDLQRSESSSSCTSESVRCTGAENTDAGALAAPVPEEEAPAELERIIAKEVNHKRLFTVSSPFAFHVILQFTRRTV